MTGKSKITWRNKKSDLRKLVLLMNRQNKRFMPPFEPILQCIDMCISPEEINLLLKMGTATYSYEEIAALSGMSREKFNPIFESLVQKTFLGTFESETGKDQYCLHPFIVGWLEGVVSYLLDKPEGKEFAKIFMSFFTSLRDRNHYPVRKIMDIFGKFTPVTNQSVGTVYESKNEKGKSRIVINETVVVPDTRIYPTNSVNDMIMEYGKKSIIGRFKKCMCREMTSQIDDPCRFKIPDDISCTGFGDHIKPYLKKGYMIQISKEEAFDLLQKARDYGMVHSMFHEKDDAKLPQVGICNCCWDCCGIFRSYNMGAVPLRYDCYYIARIADNAKCTGCGRCEKFCPTAAMKVVNKKVELDTKKCIGCGQCVHQCVRLVVELVENRRIAFLPTLKKSEARITG